MSGSPPKFPSRIGVGERLTRQAIDETIQRGRGRMPAFANISPEQVHALVNYLVYGQKEMPSPSEPAPNIKYRFTGYKRFLTPKAILR